MSPSTSCTPPAYLFQDTSLQNINSLSPTSKSIRRTLTSPLPSNFERTLKATDSSSPTELFQLVQQKRWPDVLQRLTDHKNEAATWVVDRSPDGIINWRNLPLHTACENYPPEDVVKLLVAAHPRALQLKNATGALPLHLACRERANASVITILMKLYPEAAQIIDNDGRLPLHLASRQWVEAASIEGLIAGYHDAAGVADGYGLLPLHWACAQNASVEVVAALFAAYPRGSGVEDKWGRTPVTLVEMSENPNKDEIIVILSRRQKEKGAVTDEFDFSSVDDPACDYDDDEDNDELRGADLEVMHQSAESLAVELEKKAKLSSSVRDADDVHSLEAKLMEVTATSSAAAQSFRNLRNILTKENASLKTRLMKMSSQNEEQEQQIGGLLDENEQLKSLYEELVYKNNSFLECVREMESQRQAVLSVGNKWEDVLRCCDEIIPEEE